MPQINYQGFYKWIAQDDYTTQAKQVLFSSGLDLNNDTYSVQLESSLVEGRTTNGNAMLSWFYVETTGGNRTPVAAGESWEVYKETGTNDAADFSFVDGRTTSNAINMGWFVYFIRTLSNSPVIIGKMDENNTSISWVTETLSTTGDTLPTDTLRSTYPVYNFNDEILMIGVWGTLCTINSSDVVTNYSIFSDAIVGITKIGSQFKIYSSNWQVAFWSFWASSVSESYNIGANTGSAFIRGAINRGNVDFMVSGFNSNQSNVHLTSGYEAPILAHRFQSDRITEDKYNIELERPTHLTRLGDTIYLLNNTNNTALWSFGNKTRWLWDAFQEIFEVNPGWAAVVDSIWGFQGSGWNSIFMWITVGWVEKIGEYEIWWAPRTTWYMILPTLDGWDRTVQKKIKKIYVTTSGTSTDNPIKISASFNQWAYQDIRTITTGWNSARTTITEFSEDWIDVNFRIDLTDGGTWTPKFHGMRVVYDVIKEN